LVSPDVFVRGHPVSAVADVFHYTSSYEHLVDELDWLDRLIRLRTLTLPDPPAPESQVSRAVFISPAEFEWLLETRPPRELQDQATVATSAELSKLRGEIDARIVRSAQQGISLALPQLGELFDLSTFEQQVVLICLAPELRRKYDRV